VIGMVWMHGVVQMWGMMEPRDARSMSHVGFVHTTCGAAVHVTGMNAIVVLKKTRVFLVIFDSL